MATTQLVPSPNFGNQPNNLPFTVQYSSYPTSQINSQNNINAIPNGPLFPTKPIFPSSLPPALSQYPSSVQTNFINVKREACICTLRTSNLIIDAGFKGNTFFQVKNLPDSNTAPNGSQLFNLLVDNTGKVYKKSIKILPNTSINNRNVNRSLPEDATGETILLDDPVLFGEEL